MNRLREKVKPRYKLPYKVLKEEYVYDTLIDIYPYTISIKMKDFIGGIPHCGTCFGKCIFDSNFSFALPLAQDNMDYSCIHDNEKRN